MTKHNAAHFQAIRKELAEELGYDPDNLSTLESMRVDVVFGLRSSLDELRARMFEGAKVDTNEMRQIADTLEKFLPRHAQPDTTPAIFKDPRAALDAVITRWFAAKRASEAEEAAERLAKGLPAQPPDYESALSEIEALRAELGELRGMLPAADPTVALPEPERTITPSISDIVPPSERADLPQNQQYWNGKPIRPGSRVVNGKLEPIPAKANSGAE